MTEGPADADLVSPNGILLDPSKDRLDNFGVGDKVQLDYNHTKGSTDKPIDGDITSQTSLPKLCLCLDTISCLGTPSYLPSPGSPPTMGTPPL